MSAARKIVATSLMAAAAGSPCLALAEDTYQAEAGLSFSRSKTGTVRIDTAGAEASYFFDKLSTQPRDYPLEQTQFVERIGSVSAHYGRSSFHVEGFDTLSKGSTYGAAVDFRRPDTPLTAAVGYAFSRSGKIGGFTFESQSEVKFYQLSIGTYLDKATAISLDWMRDKARGKTTSSIQPSTDSHDTFTFIGISGLHLARLSGGEHVALLANVFQGTHEEEGAAAEKNRSAFLQATYYPTRMLGLKLGVGAERGDDRSTEGEFYLAGTNTFVTPTVSLALDYQRFSAKAPGAENTSAFLLKGSLRF